MSDAEILETGARQFGLELRQHQDDQFEAYYCLLKEWNAKINLTAITGRNEVYVKHFLDSLSVARALPVRQLDGREMIDIGSGAGFPGIPLAIAFPQLQVALLEATQRKTAFLETVVKSLNLENVKVVNGRAEELARSPDLREMFDFAVARAVAELRVLVEYALPFVKVGGRFIAQKSATAEDEVASAKRAIETLGGKLLEPIPIQIPSIDEPRQLIIVEKVAPTPAAYPRRVGIPSKRPL